MSKYLVPFCHLRLLRLCCLSRFVSSLQGCADAGPEGEEGQGFGGRPALGRHFWYTAGGVEQPGQQPLAQPPA